MSQSIRVKCVLMHRSWVTMWVGKMIIPWSLFLHCCKLQQIDYINFTPTPSHTHSQPNQFPISDKFPSSMLFMFGMRGAASWLNILRVRRKNLLWASLCRELETTLPLMWWGESLINFILRSLPPPYLCCHFMYEMMKIYKWNVGMNFKLILFSRMSEWVRIHCNN